MAAEQKLRMSQEQFTEGIMGAVQQLNARVDTFELRLIDQAEKWGKLRKEVADKQLSIEKLEKEVETLKSVLVTLGSVN